MDKLSAMRLIGAALTYGLWLRGIARLEPQTVSLLGMLSRVVAIALGWLFLGQGLGPMQVLGAVASWRRSGVDSGCLDMRGEADAGFWCRRTQES